MAAPNLNAQQVFTDQYTDASTVIFAAPRRAFGVTVTNGAVMYQLGWVDDVRYGTRDVTWEHLEHQLLPSMNQFTDTAGEGLPPMSWFAGIRFRSPVFVGSPITAAVVTVI